MIVNRLTFADMAGVSRALVTQSIKRGALVALADGNLNTVDPVNAAYLGKRKKIKGAPAEEKKPRAKKAPAKKPEPKKKKEKVTTRIESLDGLDIPVDPVGDFDDVDEPQDQLAKISVDIRLKKAQAKRHELKYEQDKGNLIPVEVVERTAARFSSELKIRLQDLPTRIAPRLSALAKSGAEDVELIRAMESEIDSALESLRSVLVGVK
jgi:hypothetical protein